MIFVVDNYFSINNLIFLIYQIIFNNLKMDSANFEIFQEFCIAKNNLAAEVRIYTNDMILSF